jgi:hypothetical protein
MRTFEATQQRSPSVTGAEFVAVQRVWSIAGWPSVSGYGAAVLAVLLASAPELVDLASSIDADDATAVAAAVDALLQWRDDAEQHLFRPPSSQPGC